MITEKLDIGTLRRMPPVTTHNVDMLVKNGTAIVVLEDYEQNNTRGKVGKIIERIRSGDIVVHAEFDCHQELKHDRWWVPISICRIYDNTSKSFIDL